MFNRPEPVLLFGTPFSATVRTELARRVMTTRQDERNQKRMVDALRSRNERRHVRALLESHSFDDDLL